MNLKEYMRELRLMEKQYGQEEELYPLINILIRENCDIGDVSIRQVAGARNAKESIPGRSLLSCGDKVFPDMVLLSPKANLKEKGNCYQFLYGCVEAKKKDNKLIAFNEESSQKTSENNPYTIKYQKKIQKRVVEEVTKNNKTSKKFVCYSIDYDDRIPDVRSWTDWPDEKDEIIKPVLEGKNWELETNYQSKKSTEPLNTTAYRVRESFELKVDNKPIQHEDLNELVMEILWYKKVLYTNGLVWKYLELVDSNINREAICKKKNIFEINSQITIKCKTICELDFPKDENDDNNENNKREWKRLTINLKIINWSYKKKTNFAKFIFKEDTL